MIYTITLNPALDRTLWVDGLRPDRSNRIRREVRYAGGKGIDVSRVLKELGGESIALGFVGGFDGLELEGRLLNDGINCDFIRISGETRINLVIYEERTGFQISLNALGPQIQPPELAELIQKVRSLKDARFVVLSGSLPPGVKPEIYRKIVELAKAQGARVFLDADGEALRTGLKALPYAIKPNRAEFSELVGEELKDIEGVGYWARQVQRQGVEVVMVSLGAKGILMAVEKEALRAVPPEVKVQSKIGAGDSSVAGFVLGLEQGKSLRECLRWAVAAGTATTLNPGTALCRRADFEALLPKVEFKSL